MSGTVPQPGPAGTTARYARVAGIIETDLGTELILLDPATQEMFSLNAAGRTIWRLLDEEPVAVIVDRMVDAFDVSRETASADARALLRRLVEAKLAVAVE